jgi:ABC-type multidrug transport system ATPase subunit
MAFDPTRLKKKLILDAASYIDNNDGLKLNPSTVYDVVINEKRYPPKEIIRYAYRLAFGEDVGLIYGGEQVNKPLRELGFEIVRKQSVWKLGCNWGKGAPSFYDFIKREKIVITYKDFIFEAGDLVAITEGFIVRAIAKVKTQMAVVTTIENYLQEFQRYDIGYDETVLYAEADWYELQETEVYTYELQQGIRRIQSNEILNKTIDTWDNRNTKISKFIFYSHSTNDLQDKHTREYPCFVFEKTPWDDYGFQTTYLFLLYRSAVQYVKIGHVKVLQSNATSTILPNRKFKSLNKTFCSLGQSLEFYSRLKSEAGQQYKRILTAINDCAFNPNVRRNFEKTKGFNESLLRTSEAELALKTARRTLLKKNYQTSYYFDYTVEIKNASKPHHVDFSFDAKGEIPNRFFCLVGRNGTGKTKFIASLAKDLFDGEKEGRFVPLRPIFSKTIAISFSYFDSFETPRSKDISYTFIGIKQRDKVLSETQTIRTVWKALRSISTSRKRKELWMNSLRRALEFDYLPFDLRELEAIATPNDFRNKTKDIFSSGQNIVFQVVTRLIAAIEFNSLVLFDEPETHLHPSISGRLIRTINSILNDFESFGILATHSPVIVQEIPSKFIRIFDRSENTPVIYQPPIECFGENLSNISNSIFQTDKEKELYKQTLDSLVEKYSDKQIQEIFSDKLSLNASIYLKTISSKND